MASAGGLYLPKVDFAVKAAPTSDIGTVVPQETLNEVATPPSQQQAQCAAIDTVIPITYGTDRIGARVADLAIHNGKLVMFVVWGYGPYDGLVAFTIDDAAPPAGVTATHYDGTQVAADPTLAAIYGGGYADVLANIVYSVVQIPAGATAGFPQLAATWRGRKLYDHRTGLTVWSDNPSLALADYLASTVYGMGKSPDWASVDVAANANDALVGGVKRRTFGLTLDTRQEAGAWRDTLRTYASCWLLDDGQSVRLVPDRPGSSVAHFSHDLGNLKSLGPLKLRGLKDVPTVMEIAWTDTSQTPWREAIATAKASGVDAGTTPIRLSRVALPGIRDAAQANREAIERLNKLTLADLSTEIEVFDEAVVIEPGDIAELSHPVGLAAKPFRVSSASGQLGRYSLALDEYDPACWSDSVATDSTYPDTNLPNPASPPALAGLTLAEEVYELRQNLNPDGTPRDSAYASRIRATWTAPTWPYLHRYYAELWDGASLIQSGNTEQTVWVTPAIQEGTAYTLRVAIISSVGAAGPWADASLTAAGKYLLPGNVPSITGFEVGGEVRLSISAATDLDMVGYEIHYGPVGCSWALSSTVKFVDFVNTASGVGGYCVFRDAPAGTWDFLVCARDSVGQYSPTPARITLTVTLDVNAFLVGNHAFTNPTPTGMAEYSLPGDPARYWVTEDSVMAATKFPTNPASSYGNVAATYHASQTSEIVTEAWDVGVAVGGNWAGTVSSVALSGSKVDQISLSPDGTTYTDQGSLTAKANGRFGKLKATATGTSTLKVSLPTLALRIDAIPRVENGTVTTNASGYTRITLANSYTAVKSLNLTPQGTASRQAVADNIVVNGSGACSFDLYLFNSAGAQIAGPVMWDWKGV